MLPGCCVPAQVLCCMHATGHPSHSKIQHARSLPNPCSCTACGSPPPARPRCSVTMAASSRPLLPLWQSCSASASSTALWATRRLRALSSALIGPSKTCCAPSCWSAPPSTGPSRQVAGQLAWEVDVRFAAQLMHWPAAWLDHAWCVHVGVHVCYARPRVHLTTPSLANLPSVAAFAAVPHRRPAQPAALRGLQQRDVAV